MIISGLCATAKRDFIMGVHQPHDHYKVALYSSMANLSPATEFYTTHGEITGQGYERGGMPLRGYKCVIDGTIAVMGWTEDPVWRNASISAHGALFYNSSKQNRALVVVDFGQVIASTFGDYRLRLPPVAADTAIVRIL